MTIPTTFSWFPDAGAKLAEKPTVKTAKFGDGYSQRTTMGINSKPMSWSVKFTKTRSIGLLILAFLRARNGTEAFNWTNPLNEAGVYICREWDLVSNTPEVTEVSAVFEQVFES